jgi:MYXO-CTERM domain-containing protein
VAGEPALVGPASEGVTFAVDWEPPRVRLQPNALTGLVDVEAADAVSPPEALEYAYRVGDGALSAFGPPRQVDLAAVEGAGSLEVQVRDEAGLVGSASWRAPAAAAVAGPGAGGGGAGEQQAGPGAGGGCSSAGAGPSALWALALAGLPLALALRRRRPRENA